jgi:hypothetical protein
MAINLANNNSLANITALPSSISGGGMTLISEQTASGSATIDFTSGIDDTYDSYVFKFINCHPATDQVGFQFNMSSDTGSNYNVTKTTTFFFAYHDEADSASGLGYNTDNDLAQSTAFQNLNFPSLSNDNDSNISGTLTIYNPSSTTFVKHFIANTNGSVEQSGGSAPYTENFYVAGYGNTTSAIDAIRFQMSSGNIDSGVIKLYGIS